jgi:hypothetical protein
MRRVAQVDENQPEVVAALRGAGASVQILSAVGHGCPDILVGYNGRTLLMEIKFPLGTPSHRKLTPPQVEWHARWKGQLAIVHSAKEALDILMEATGKTP